ncbi:MAG: nucleoside monophosphate kinase [Patescibacteria group bacterium]|jgi:adenylate kinase
MNNHPKFIILMGPPGSGKGTQAKLLQQQFGLNYISTGDLTRDIVQHPEIDPPLAAEVKKRYDQGILLPDEMILKLVRDTLLQIDLSKGLLYDGFPRTTAQITGLEKLRAEFRLPEPVMISIDVSEAEIVRRLSLRKYCPKDHVSYHPDSVSFKTDKCELCGTTLERRSDDDPAIIRKRYALYRASLDQLIEWYGSRGRLIRINGEPAVPEVSKEIIEQLEKYRLMAK